MPIYDYQCEDCKKQFKIMHSMSEECTECGYCLSSNVTRVVADVVNHIDESKYKSKAGDLVKSHIEEARKEIREQKQEMKRGVK